MVAIASIAIGAKQEVKASSDSASCLCQWQSLPFQIMEEHFLFNEHFIFYYSILDDIHIPFTQLNITAIGLGYYMILKFSLYPS
jgi:hypothetical protein